ncbi:hypothetical protein H8E52_06465 [bacterium]|nr:hypothetical protein [bacterium]
MRRTMMLLSKLPDMQRSIPLLIAILLYASTTLASWGYSISIFEEPETLDCTIQCEVGEWSTFTIIAHNPNWPNSGIVGVEFGLNNWIGGIPDFPGEIVITYASELHLGDLGSYFNMAWSQPQLGELVEILRVDFRCSNLEWLYPGFEILVREGDECDCIRITDGEFNYHEAVGTNAFINCSEGYFYIQDPPWVGCFCEDETSSIETKWSIIKSLY